MASLGSLVVSLGLDAAEFVSGLTKSEYEARKFAQRLEKSVAAGVIKAEIAIRSFASAARATADVFQSLTVDAAQFKDLEESTGASAEGLASLAVAGATAGVNMESIGSAANKLTKSLVGVDDESKAAGAALKALNLNIQDFKSLDPVAQYEAVGNALAQFEDGAAKVAVAQALFGKSGAEQLKVFKALEEQGGRTVILTQRQIELADAYADAQAKATAEIRMYAQAAASEALPALTDLTKVATDLAKEMLGIDRETARLATNNGVKTFAEVGIDALAELVDIVDKTARGFVIAGNLIGTAAGSAVLVAMGKFKEAVQAGRNWEQQTREILDGSLNLQDRIAKQRAQSANGGLAASLGIDAIGASDAPAKRKLVFNGPPDTSAVADAAKERKRLLDGQIKDIRAFADEQREAFEFANRIVEGTYADGLISLQQSFESQRQIRSEGLRATIASLDSEVAALKAHAKTVAKPEERIDVQNRIADAEARRSQALQRAQQDNVLSAMAEGRAVLALRDQYNDLRATVLQLSGNTSGANAIRIDRQVEDARKVLTQMGRETGFADIYGELLRDTERLSQAQSNYSDLVERSRLTEESLLLLARERGSSELETMRAVGAARARSLEQLEQMVQEARQLAAVLGTPEAIRFAEQLTVQLQRASAEVEPLLLKIREVGEEAGFAIAGGFEDAIVQGESLRDVLKGIEKDLLAIGTRELVTKPLGDWLTNLIGGNGAPSGGGGLIGKVLGMFGGGGGGFGGFGLPGSFAGLFAGGGYLGAGNWGIAGEAGPEIVRGPANIIPSNRSMQMLSSAGGQSGGGGSTLNVEQHFHFSSPTDRQTQGQIGARALRGLADARRFT